MLNTIIDFVFKLDPISMLIAAIFSALIALWFDFHIKKPKLERLGSGSGRNDKDTTIRNSLSFLNKVGWFGIMVHETRIIGWRIHPSFRIGLTFEKNPARDCRANLYLKDTMEHVGLLWWKNHNNTLSETVTIESGKQSSLILFCRNQNDGEHYYVYKPISRDNDISVTPDKKIQFVGEREFILRIDYSHSHKYEEVIRISRKYNGLLYLETKNSSSIF